ncbi:MAG: hypothetical protein K2Z81_16590, partial [Cyanobacteria bacterium]|nr:hypothetical protein [Cyanobacteriota bacterium]
MPSTELTVKLLPLSDRETDYLVEIIAEHSEFLSSGTRDAYLELLKGQGEDRLKSAEAFLGEDSSGLAHFILATESEFDYNQQVAHLASAVEKSRSSIDNGSALLFVNHLHLWASTRLAHLYGESGKNSLAIEVLEKSGFDTMSEMSQLELDVCRFNLVCYLIQENEDEKARKVLDGDPVPTVEWYYLNALLRFRELGGDSADSRGALSIALREEFAIGRLLSGAQAKRQLENEPPEYAIDYANLTKAAWAATDGAIAWLYDRLENSSRRVGEEAEVDEARFLRSVQEFDLGLSHLHRNNPKDAKRAFNQALRESERLNDGGEFFMTMVRLISELRRTNNDSITDLIERLEARFKFLQRQTADPEKLFLSMVDLGNMFLELGALSRADECAKKAFALWQTHAELLNT